MAKDQRQDPPTEQLTGNNHPTIEVRTVSPNMSINFILMLGVLQPINNINCVLVVDVVYLCCSA